MRQPKEIDLRKCKTREEVARGIFDGIKRIVGADECTEMFLMDPDRSEECGYGRTWRVMWEGGPYEWGIKLSLEDTLFGTRFLMPSGFYLEPYYSFDVGVYE